MAGGNQPDRPPLHLIHDEQSFSPTNLRYWRSKDVDYILASFVDPRNPNYQPLLVRADGTVLNGNTRLFVLQERGYDIDTISRTPPP
jgi:hypothetical protein